MANITATRSLDVFGIGGLSVRLVRRVRSVWASTMHAYRVAATMRALQSLSPRQLEDIGIHSHADMVERLKSID